MYPKARVDRRGFFVVPAPRAEIFLRSLRISTLAKALAVKFFFILLSEAIQPLYHFAVHGSRAAHEPSRMHAETLHAEIIGKNASIFFEQCNRAMQTHRFDGIDGVHSVRPRGAPRATAA